MKVLSAAQVARTERIEQPMPKHNCATCTKCQGGNRCQVFNRHIVDDYNRCFFHSNYRSTLVVYKTPENLVEMVLRNEAKASA